MDSFNVDEAKASMDNKFRAKIREDLAHKAALAKAMAEYDELDNTLGLIVSKRKHDVMVPIGKKAFFPGYIKHTNEVTVAIGDNYFIKCSVQSARGIVERRKKFIQDKVNVIDEEFAFLKSKLGLVSEVLGGETRETEDGFIEIIENEDSLDEIRMPISKFTDDDDDDELPVKRPFIEVLSETVTEEEVDDDMLLLEHFSRLEKIAETNPHTPSEIFKHYQSPQVKDSDLPSKPMKWGADRSESLLYMERKEGEKSFFGGDEVVEIIEKEDDEEDAKKEEQKEEKKITPVAELPRVREKRDVELAKEKVIIEKNLIPQIYQSTKTEGEIKEKIDFEKQKIQQLQQQLLEQKVKQEQKQYMSIEQKLQQQNQSNNKTFVPMVAELVKEEKTKVKFEEKTQKLRFQPIEKTQEVSKANRTLPQSVSKLPTISPQKQQQPQQQPQQQQPQQQHDSTQILPQNISKIPNIQPRKQQPPHLQLETEKQRKEQQQQLNFDQQQVPTIPNPKQQQQQQFSQNVTQLPKIHPKPQPPQTTTGEKPLSKFKQEQLARKQGGK